MPTFCGRCANFLDSNFDYKLCELEQKFNCLFDCLSCWNLNLIWHKIKTVCPVMFLPEILRALSSRTRVIVSYPRYLNRYQRQLVYFCRETLVSFSLRLALVWDSHCTLELRLRHWFEGGKWSSLLISSNHFMSSTPRARSLIHTINKIINIEM